MVSDVSKKSRALLAPACFCSPGVSVSYNRPTSMKEWLTFGELKHGLFARTCQRYRARVVVDLTGLGQIGSIGQHDTCNYSKVRFKAGEK